MAKKNLKYQSPGINEETRFEKLHTVNFESSQEASSLIAREICDLVKSKQEKNKSIKLQNSSNKKNPEKIRKPRKCRKTRKLL